MHNESEPTGRFEDEKMILVCCEGNLQSYVLTYQPCKSGYWCQIESVCNGKIGDHKIFIGVAPSLDRVEEIAKAAIQMFEGSRKDSLSKIQLI